MKFNKLCMLGWYCLLLLVFIILCFTLPINLGMLLAVVVGTLTICSITVAIIETKQPKNKSTVFMAVSIIGTVVLWILVVIFSFFFRKNGGI